MKKILSFLIVSLLIMSTSFVVYAEEPPPINPAILATNPVIITEAQPAASTTPVVIGPPAMIVVHRISNTCFVYDANLQLLKTFIVSTGREGHRTPLGTYSIYEHSTGTGYHLMVDGTYGRFCMRFKKGGYMFHSVCYAYPGAPEPLLDEVAALGTSVSRGCVRLSVADAEWLYNSTSNGCLVNVVDD
ncbi:L,D-transpeptidase [Candidatus Saccharibacteria bacterium]|nr:L,D-transpeptidase [Candidatus Saccharibacteria bacterium]